MDLFSLGRIFVRVTVLSLPWLVTIPVAADTVAVIPFKYLSAAEITQGFAHSYSGWPQSGEGLPEGVRPSLAGTAPPGVKCWEPNFRRNTLQVAGTPKGLRALSTLTADADRPVRTLRIDVRVLDVTERGARELAPVPVDEEGEVRFGLNMLTRDFFAHWGARVLSVEEQLRLLSRPAAASFHLSALSNRPFSLRLPRSGGRSAQLSPVTARINDDESISLLLPAGIHVPKRGETRAPAITSHRVSFNQGVLVYPQGSKLAVLIIPAKAIP